MTAQVFDTLAVCGVCLRDLVAPIIEQERAKQGSLFGGRSYGQRGATFHQHDGTLGFIDVLTNESGISQRRLTGILSCEYATVALTQADNLLCALDRPDLLHSLTVFQRVRGSRLGTPGEHVPSSACRLAAVEPSLRTPAPVAEDLLTNHSRREAA